ncbi:hypothetical protein E2C01_017794 [Portunus trituberculatus]|uniref:Uncharacterized protein n=1 Tax=Portunus trituberculatus TaxID=210409 RepID=A0A5B7DUT4_PORTR|nr:hypothetical protein [Portunus trituberculatus]
MNGNVDENNTHATTVVAGASLAVTPVFPPISLAHFVLAATTIVLTPTNTTGCAGRGHVDGKSLIYSDMLRERSDVTREPCDSLCSHQGTASLNSNCQACTRWSVATLPPKVNFAKLRFTKCGSLLYSLLQESPFSEISMFTINFDFPLPSLTILVN